MVDLPLMRLLLVLSLLHLQLSATRVAITTVQSKNKFVFVANKCSRCMHTHFDVVRVIDGAHGI